MLNSDRIFVAGHNGMVGSAVVRLLKKNNFHNIVVRDRIELDLTNQSQVREFFRNKKIDRIILAAAKVGGIHANNSYPAEFIYSNLMIQTNIIHEAYLAGIKHLLFLGSSCIYPKHCPQPMEETHLLSGELEPTNEPYAIAKIAGIKMCESYNRQYGTWYRSIMPTNLYGQGDNYHLENSHVIPAMIRKYHLAALAEKGDCQAIIRDQETYGEIPPDICQAIGYNPSEKKILPEIKPTVVLWGNGSPKREFLHVDDMADACLHFMKLDQSNFCTDKPSFINIGYGKDITIAEISKIICTITGFSGETVFDSNKPNGTPRKLLNCNRAESLGWKPQLSLEDGLIMAYEAYKKPLLQEGCG